LHRIFASRGEGGKGIPASRWPAGLFDGKGRVLANLTSRNEGPARMHYDWARKPLLLRSANLALDGCRFGHWMADFTLQLLAQEQIEESLN
jgi:hypothetical protein